MSDFLVTELTGFVLLLISALCGAFHVLFVKVSTNRMVLYASLNLVSAALGFGLVWFFPLPDPASWPYIIGSGVTYTILVFWYLAGYERTDISQLAPLIIGMRVTVVTVFALTLLGEMANGWEAFALGVLFAGVLIQVHPKQWLAKYELQGIAICLIAGLLSGIQHCFDYQGIRLSGNPLSYIVWNMFIGLPITFYGFCRYRRQLKSFIIKEKFQIIAASLLDVTSYSLLIYVVYSLRAIYVLPLSNLSLVFITLIGAFFLKEHYAPRRFVAAAMIFISVVLMQF